MILYRIFLISAILIEANYTLSQETIRFPSGDQVEITADLFNPHPKSNPIILLFHQAGWSRGEYAEIVPLLTQQGFNCLAVDLRSGGKVNGVNNETSAAARRNLKETGFLDAYQDMTAAIELTAGNYADGKIIIWGSSYSASLVLKYAGDNPGNVDGVLAFSPGEYFKSESANFVSNSAGNIEAPAFITSSKNEQKNWKKIYDSIPSKGKRFYIPQTSGNHGSRALWAKYPDHRGYREAVNSFLVQFQ